MLTWLLIAAIVVVVTGLVATRGRASQRALPSGAATALIERGVRDIRTHDVVQHGAKDYLVEGVISFDEDGHTWREARMVDSGNESWMLVGLERTGFTVRMMEVAKDLQVTGYPPETLEHAGVSYKLDKRGTATVTFSGDTPGVPGAVEGGSSRCRWWKYQAVGDKVLYLEQWGEEYRALVGVSVRADDVDLLGAT